MVNPANRTNQGLDRTLLKDRYIVRPNRDAHQHQPDRLVRLNLPVHPKLAGHLFQADLQMRVLIILVRTEPQLENHPETMTERPAPADLTIRL